MTRYLLDTNVLIDAVRHREPAWSRVRDLNDSQEDLGVTAVAIAEFFAGTPEARRAGSDELLSGLLYWPITREAARQAGVWRYDFARQGRTLGIPDVLIAAVAREMDAILITKDSGDFPMQGITFEAP